MNTFFEPKDIMLEATAEVQQIVREVMEELAEPQTRAEVMQMWMTMPDGLKEQYAADNPDEHRALMELMSRR